MAYNEPMPTPGPDGNTVSAMSDWEAYFVTGLGGASYVMPGRGGELVPSINSAARTVSTATGAAFVRGFLVTNTAGIWTATVPTQSAADRVDRLVLRLDRSASTKANWLKPVILPGSSGSASPPALQASDTGLYDLPVARWTTKANGTLTGLVDERYRSAGGPLDFNSFARPPASPPRMGLERDTGIWRYSNGSAWLSFDSDTGWTEMTLNNTSWKNNGTEKQLARIRNGVVYLRVNITRQTSTFTKSDADGSLLFNLAAPLIPDIDQYDEAHFSGGIGTARVQILQSNGALSLQHNTADVAVGRTCTFSMSYPAR